MDILKALWDVMNGKKLNTATVITILILALQTMGMAKEEAVQAVSAVMAGVAGVLAIVGFLHRLWKARQQKKNDAKKTQFVGGPGIKLLIIGTIFVMSGIWSSALAVERFEKPFMLWLSEEQLSPDTASWQITPSISLPALVLKNSIEGKGLVTESINSVGFGIDYGRFVKSTTGKIVETFGGEVVMLLSSDKSLAVTIQFHIFNRLIGIGPWVNTGICPKQQRYGIAILTNPVEIAKRIKASF